MKEPGGCPESVGTGEEPPAPPLRPSSLADLREAVREQGERIGKFRAGLAELGQETRGLERDIKRKIINNLRAKKAPKQKIDAATKELEAMLGEVIIEQGAQVRRLRTGRAGKSAIAEAERGLEALKAEFLADTGREWSEVREEGPILLTTNEVRGSEVLPDVKAMTKRRLSGRN